MNIDRHVLVTTTQQLEGWKIEEYLGPVSAHIVAGTGFFSDFAASFSDIFGGHSLSYQKQLSRINDEVIELIKAKVVQKGGNCVLGMRIDHDEISGKAKQMFMVTAIGTAGYASRISKPDSKKGKGRPVASAADVQAELKKLAMLKELQKPGPHNVNWDYFRENEVWEAAPYLVKLMGEQMQQYALWEDGWRKCVAYLGVIPLKDAKTQLYSLLTSDDANADKIIQAIDDLAAFDGNLIREFLKSEKATNRVKALKLFKTNKEYYEGKDTVELEQLLAEIVAAFPRKPLADSKQGLLKSKDVKVWTCSCGETNEEVRKQCKCGRDIYGVPAGNPNPDELKTFCLEKSEAIKNLITRTESLVND